MTIAKPDQVRTATDASVDVDVDAHAYAWYDPDSAAFDRPDARGEVEPTDEDEAQIFDWG